MARDEQGRTLAAQNRKARFNYAIEDRLEAGIVLTGTEVKSLRGGKASIEEAHAGPQDGVLMLFNAFIPEYGQAGRHLQHEPRRPRALLLHKNQHNKWLGAVAREGMTIVPLAIYFNARGRAKVELALAKGKDRGDKRATIKERDWQRDKARLMRKRR